MAFLDLMRAARSRGGRALWFLAAVLLPPSGAGRAEAAPQEPVEAASGARPEVRAIASDQILISLQRVDHEVELIRRRLGGLAPEERRVMVEGAPPREAYFHARLLYRRADELALEHTGLRVASPPTVRGKVLDADVWTVVEAALQRLEDARTALEIEALPIVPTPHPDPRPGDVLRAVLEAGRAIDALVRERPTNAELHHTITRGLAHASSLRATFPGPRMPVAYPTEAVRTEEDVQRKLCAALSLLERISQRAGLGQLRVLPDAEDETASADDLRDAAELLEAELQFLEERYGDPRWLPPTCRRSAPTNDEVYRRASLLQSQIENLLGCVTEARDWPGARE